MGNLVVILPTNAANGPGAAVDVSSLDAVKTITVGSGGGVFQPIVTIEISNDVGGVNWSPLVSFTGQGEKQLTVAAHWMRANVSNFITGGAPSVGVGAADNACSFASPAVPVGIGNLFGAALDISQLPGFMTIQVVGPFGGTINVQVSDDNQATFHTIASFNAPGQLSVQAVGDHMRLHRQNVPVTNQNVPVVSVAANSGGAAAGNVPLSITNVAVANTPYNIKSSDDYLFVDTTGGPVTLILPNPALFTFAKQFFIVDTKGNFGVNNLTLQPFGGELIMGLALSKVFQTPWGAWTVVTDGVNWYVQ